MSTNERRRRVADLHHIQHLLTNPLCSSLELILAQYHRAREQEQKFDRTHPQRATFRALERALSSSEPVKRRQPSLTVTWSLGMDSPRWHGRGSAALLI
jgi:hypothetical protein